MKMIEGIFYKDYPCGSSVKISFIKTGGPIIAQDIEKDSIYKKQMEEDSDLFYLKKLDRNTLNLLKKMNFKPVQEVTQDH